MNDLVRLRLAWPLVVPLLVFGLAAGHELTYRLTVPSQIHDHTLDATGHGYFDYLTLALGVCLALFAGAFGWRVSDFIRGGSGRSAPAAVFALLPPLAFAFQEHLERLVHAGQFPWELVTEPTFLVGLALQIPFAIAAVLLAKACESLARQVARVLATPPRAARFAPFLPPFAADVILPRLHPLALADSERGPPALS